MDTIQVVMERSLVKAADAAARRAKVNRSALIREALREHLRRLRTRALEDEERLAYARMPQGEEEAAWDAVGAWPPK